MNKKSSGPELPVYFRRNYRDTMDSVSFFLFFFLAFLGKKIHSHRNRQTEFTSPLEFTAAQTSSPVGVSNPTCQEIDGLLSISNI